MGCEPRRFDLTMLRAAYAAFRRATVRLEAVALADGALASTAVANSWSLFTSYWRVQDVAEKRALWTVMAVADLEPVHGPAVLDAMDLQTMRVVPLMDAVDAALERRDQLMFARYMGELRVAVGALLDFKESDVLPLIPHALTPYEWGTFDVEFRREVGVRGLRVFLPWLLDGAPEPTRRAVLGLLPPPIRLVYRARWRPRYERRSRLPVPAC